MLTVWTLRNSSLRPLMDAFCKDCDDGSSARRPSAAKVSLMAIFAVFVLREGSRVASRHLPYVKAILEPAQIDSIPASWSSNRTNSFIRSFVLTYSENQNTIRDTTAQNNII